MADGTGVADDYYTVELAAQLTGRSKDMLYRYIRNGIIQAIQDPQDGRVRLIPWTEMAKVITQPKKGLRRKEVTLTLGDGTTITRIAQVPVER